MKILIKILTLLLISTFSTQLWALTCGGLPTYDREASVTSTQLCDVGLGNPDAGDIGSIFGTTPSWTEVGEFTGAGTSTYFSVSVTSGAFGSSPVSGAWTVDSSFWATYTEAVISMHVGNGGGDPDYFAFLLEDDASSGTWRYEILQGNGGGLSNLKLWGRTTYVVTEPASLALIGLGLVCLGLSRRRNSVEVL